MAKDPAIAIEIENEISYGEWAQEAIEIAEARLKKFFAALAAANDPKLAKCLTYLQIEAGRDQIVIAVLYSNDADIARFNQEFRGKEGPTNVLSFPAMALPISYLGSNSLGDLALAYETIWQEAMDQQISFVDHLSHLLLHGGLHLIGYDHIETEQAEEMEALEGKLLALAAIANPYN